MSFEDNNNLSGFQRAQGRKKSNFPTATTVTSGASIDFFIDGTNFQITFDNFVSQLGVTGTISQVGPSTATAVLTTSGTDNFIRSLSGTNGIGISVDSEGGILLSGTSTSDLTEGQVPRVDGDGGFVASGATVNLTTGVWTFDNSIIVPQASLEISDTLILTEATGSLISTDVINSIESEHVIANITTAGSSHPSLLELSNEVDIILQSDNSQQITTNPLTFSITTIVRGQTNNVVLETFATMSNVRITITDTSTSTVMMYLPDKATVRDATGGFEFISGINTIDFNSDDDSVPALGIFNIGISPFRTLLGQTITVLVEADNVALLGNSSDEPFTQFAVQTGIDVDLAYIRDTSLISDDYIEVNKDYTTIAGKTGGIVVNFLPTSTADSITSGQFTAGAAGGTNPSVVTGGAVTFTLSDLIQITGTQQNDGLYEVLSHVSTLLSIKGVGATATVEDFTKDDFITQADSGTITKVGVSVMRAASDGQWEIGTGNSTPFTYETVASGTTGNVTTSDILTDNFIVRGNGTIDIDIGNIFMSSDGNDLTIPGVVNVGGEGAVTTADTLDSLTLMVGAGTNSLQAADASGTTANISTNAAFDEILITAAVGGDASYKLLNNSGTLKAELFYEDDNDVNIWFSAVDLSLSINADLALTTQINMGFFSNTGTFTTQTGTNSITAWQVLNASSFAILNVDTTNNRLGVGTIAPLANINSLSTTEQLRLSFDVTNFASFTVDSGGDLTIATNGEDVLEISSLSTTVDSRALITRDFDTDDGVPIVTYGIASSEIEANLFITPHTSGTVNISTGASDGAVFIGRSETVGVEIDGAVRIGLQSNLGPANTDGNVLTLGAQTAFTKTKMTLRSPANSDDFFIGVNNVAVDSGSAFLNYADGTEMRLQNSAGTALSISSLNVTISGDLIVDTDTLFVDATLNRVGIGLIASLAKLHVIETTEQLRLAFDATNFASFTVDLAGGLAVDPSGGIDLTSSSQLGQGITTTAGQFRSTLAGQGRLSAFYSHSANPGWAIEDTSAVTNARVWDFCSINGVLRFAAMNNASNLNDDFMVVTRTLNIVDDIRFPVPMHIGADSTPDTLLHVESSDADTVAIITTESTGTNAGITKTFVGDQDPNGTITGAGGDIYYRDNGALSNFFFNKEATTGTEWQPVSILPTTVNQLFSTAEYEDLGTASVITTTGTRSLRFHASVVSSTNHVVSSQSAELQFIDPTEGNQMIYTGSSTFITAAAGGDITSRNGALIAAISGTQLFDYAGEGALPGVDIIEIVQSSNLAQWNLGTIGRVSTGEFGPIVRFKDTNIITTTDPMVLDSCTIVEVTSCLFDDTAKVGSGGPLFSIKDASFKEGRAVFLVNGGRLYSGESLVRIDAGLPNTYRVEVIDSVFIVNTGGSIFDTSGATGAFTAVANNSIAATTITGVTDSSGVASFTHAGTSPLLNSLVTVSGFTTNTSYNTTGIVTARTATTFEIDYVAFGTSEAGSYLVTGVTVTATAHGLTIGTGVTLDTTEAVDYDGGFLIYNIQTNSFDVPATFAATEAGTWSTKGLDQTDPRVKAFNNPETANSNSIAGGFVNDNSTANGTIVNNVFTDMVFGTAGSALTEISTAERWKMVDELNGTFAYTGLDPFEGYITFDFTVTSSGGTVNFRFKWQKSTDGGSTFSDLTDAVESLVAVSSSAQSVTKTFPLAMTKGDQIRPQITRNSGSSGITTSYATIYVSNPG